MKTNLPSKKPNHQGFQGFALILSLFIIGILTLLLLGFFSLARTERKVANANSSRSFSESLAQSTINLCIGQIRLATSNLGKTQTWASQPGLIRRYSNESQEMTSAYKLYSAKKMILENEEINFSDDLPPENWLASEGVWTDLNEPIRRDDDGNGVYEKLYYPIVNANLAKITTQENSINSDDEIEGFEIVNAPRIDENQACPMPVRWLYVLKNGDLASAERKNNQTIIEKASKENPIVGRIAFWTDDETCKVNINTSSEGIFWKTPRTTTDTDAWAYDRRQPIRNEFQRYPGHPAMTSLSPILKSWLGEDPNTYYQLTPRINLGGSEGGTKDIGSDVSPIIPDKDRLYASIDEYFFAANNQNKERKENHTNITPDLIDSLRFFLTARSKASELNLFNLPRISLWPLQENPLERNPIDNLMAFLSSTKKSSSLNPRERLPYYFQRKSAHNLRSQAGNLTSYSSSQSTNDDWEIERNQSLYRYLLNLMDTKIPAYGEKLSTKFQQDTTQIITQIFDFIRSGVNAYSFGSPTRTSSIGYAYAPIIPPLQEAEKIEKVRFPHTNYIPDMIPGEGQIIPLVIGDTKGFGRFITITEAALIIYPASRENIPHTIEVPNSNIRNDNDLPLLHTDRNHYQGGYLRRVEWDETNLEKANRINIHKGWKSDKFRAFLLLEYFCPSPGFPSWSPYTEIEITGLNQFSLEGKSLNFPATAKVLLHTPIPHGPNASNEEGHGHSTATMSLFQPLFTSSNDVSSWNSQQTRDFNSTDPKKGYAWHSQSDISIPLPNAFSISNLSMPNPDPIPLRVNVRWTNNNAPSQSPTNLNPIRTYKINVKNGIDEDLYLTTEVLFNTEIVFESTDTDAEKEEKRNQAKAIFDEKISETENKIKKEIRESFIETIEVAQIQPKINQEIQNLEEIIERLKESEIKGLEQQITQLKNQITLIENSNQSNESIQNNLKSLENLLNEAEDSINKINERIARIEAVKMDLENLEDGNLMVRYWTDYYIGLKGDQSAQKVEDIIFRNNVGSLKIKSEKKNIGEESNIKIYRQLELTLNAKNPEPYSEATLNVVNGETRIYPNRSLRLLGGNIKITLRDPIEKQKIQSINMNFPDTQIPEPYVYSDKFYETNLRDRIQNESNRFRFFDGYSYLPDIGFVRIDHNLGEGLTSRLFHHSLIRPGDVVRSVEADANAPPKGDFRIYAATQNVPSTWFKKGGEGGDYDDSNSLTGRFAHGLRNGTWANTGNFHSDTKPQAVHVNLIHKSRLQGGSNSNYGWYYRLSQSRWDYLDNNGDNLLRDFVDYNIVSHPFYRQSNYFIAGTLVPLEGLESNEKTEEKIINLFVPLVPRGLREAKRKDNQLGDWDNGYGGTEDGPFINKPDEGFIQPTQSYYNYDLGKWEHSLGGYFNRGSFTRKTNFLNHTPTRQITSAVAFGSLPSGVKRILPWQTLLFCPNPIGRKSSASNVATTSDHLGFKNPPDHLFLDFFWMPITEPYAISQPFATEGKINMNYQIAPFDYIKRRTPLYSVLKSCGLIALPQKKVVKTDSDNDRFATQLRGIKQNRRTAVSNEPIEYYYDIDPNPKTGTLQGFEKKFAQGKIFRSASEICEIFLVPKRRTESVPGYNKKPDYAKQADPEKYSYDKMMQWWEEFKLTGDNERENPYNSLYPRLTTKSDSYQIHFRVEKIRKSKAKPKIFDSSKDKIISKYRGSALIERYISPNEEFPDFSENNDKSLDNFYKYRIPQRKELTF